MSIAKMALSEARKSGHHVTSLKDFTVIKPIRLVQSANVLFHNETGPILELPTDVLSGELSFGILR